MHKHSPTSISKIKNFPGVTPPDTLLKGEGVGKGGQGVGERGEGKGYWTGKDDGCKERM